MALVEIPLTTIALVQHSAGGAILSNAGNYISGTYISAAVVEAFSTASCVLASIGGGAVAATTNPIILGAATIAVVAAGSYCYFYGIPVAIEAVLTQAGLGIAAKNGFAISIPQLAVALVLLGAAGYTIYKFYENYMATRDMFDHAVNATSAQKATEAAFGFDAWQTIGSVIWSGVSDAAEYAVQAAKEAVEAATIATSSAASEAGRGTAATYSIAESGIHQLLRRLKIRFYR